MSGNTNTGTVYKRILVIFILFFAVVVSIGGSISGLAKARREEKNAYKYYTSIPIGKGDTLWSIAVENITPEYAGIEEYIQEIRSLNHLSDDGIHAGRYLMIPRYFDESFAGLDEM